MLSKIISGGQTGADRAALDAGIESGFPIGGSCPTGRMAEDGEIDSRYILDEAGGGYAARTKRNVKDSGGTEQTVAFCIKARKPYKLIDIDLVNVDVAAGKLVSFVNDYRIQVLNVAGPRQSDCPAIYASMK